MREKASVDDPNHPGIRRLSGNMPNASNRFYIDSHILEPPISPRSTRSRIRHHSCWTKTHVMVDDFLIPSRISKIAQWPIPRNKTNSWIFRTLWNRSNMDQGIIPSKHDHSPLLLEIKFTFAWTSKRQLPSTFSRNPSQVLQSSTNRLSSAQASLLFSRFIPNRHWHHTFLKLTSKDENGQHDMITSMNETRRHVTVNRNSNFLDLIAR